MPKKTKFPSSKRKKNKTKALKLNQKLKANRVKHKNRIHRLKKCHSLF
jgi:hypothetical protein